MAIQKKRQKEGDWQSSLVAQLENKLEMLKKKSTKMEDLAKDAADVKMLTQYQPEVVRRMVRYVRVYGGGRIELDLHANDSFITEILESVMQIAG